MLLKPGKKDLLFNEEDNEVAADAKDNETGFAWQVLGRFLYSPMNQQFHSDGANGTNLENFWKNIDVIASQIAGCNLNKK